MYNMDLDGDMYLIKPVGEYAALLILTISQTSIHYTTSPQETNACNYNCAKAPRAMVAAKLILNGIFSVTVLWTSTLLTYFCIVLKGRRLYPFDAAH